MDIKQLIAEWYIVKEEVKKILHLNKSENTK